MYGWIWARLPGGSGTRAFIALLLVAMVVTVLLLVVFPWLAPQLPFEQVDVGGPAPCTGPCDGPGSSRGV